MDEPAIFVSNLEDSNNRSAAMADDIAEEN